VKWPCSSAVKRTQSRALVWLYMFGFALCVPCLLCVLCYVLFPLCIVLPCLYQCKIYCHRVNTQLQ
jgi:amino acid permease